jgi:MFS transporter, ACS family, D-galactonate transporter
MASAPPSRALDRPTGVRHLVLAALLAITCINYIQRNALSPAATTVGADLRLDDTDMGDILAAFFFGYTLMQVPAGAFAKWLGAKWALVLMATLWSLATAACALAQGFNEFFAARFMVGVFQAGIFSCATLILAAWYPVTSRGIASAWLNSFMLLGSVFANFFTGLLLGPLGWRWLLVVYAVPGILWAVWFAWWFRSRPPDHPGVNEAERRLIEGQSLPLPVLDLEPGPKIVSEQIEPSRERFADTGSVAPSIPVPVFRSIRRTLPLFAILAITLLCAQQACRAGANRLADVLMPTYYEKSGRMDAVIPPSDEKSQEERVSLAAYLTGCLLIASLIGSLLGGLLSDYVLRRTGSLRLARNGVALFSLLGSVALYLAAYPIANLYVSTAVFALGLLLFNFSSPCAYAVTMDMGGKNLAIVFGLMNMAGNLGAWAFISFLPRLAQSHGWDAALLVYIAMHLVAAACWMGLDPNAELKSPKRVDD